MIRFTDLSLRRGTRELIRGLNLTIHPGQRVGLVGANGTGKSSLMALIMGIIHPDTGECAIPPNLTIAHVAQETPALTISAIDHTLDGDQQLRALQSKLASAEEHHDNHQIAHLHGELEAIDAYTAPSRAAQLLNGLGFSEADLTAPVASFSGGWRMRLNLAQALMCRSDLLLLDEPTNHLDLEAIIWLEQWLTQYPGTIILISHDRSFLDSTTTHTLSISQQQATLYTGAYSRYEALHAAQLAEQTQAYEKQQRERAHMENFVRRFKAKATKAKQAQSRIKALERMVEIAPAHVDSPFHFSFAAPIELPDPLLTLQDGAINYGTEKPLLSALNLSISNTARIGLLGPNGAGKTSLIQLLANRLDAHSQGQLTPAKQLSLSYFAQHQLEQLDSKADAMTHLFRLNPKANQLELRNFLGGFGFSGDRAFEPIAPFSGGEKARLALALVVYRQPNLLLLDEPTNHLDIEMRQALTNALQAFQGGIVMVSHDRHLLESCCDEFWLVADQTVQPFDGDLEDYRRWAEAHHQQQSNPAASAHETSKEELKNTSKKALRQEAAALRKALQPLKKEVDKLEKQLTKAQASQESIQQDLADPELYDADRSAELKSLLAKDSAIKQTIAELEERWMEAVDTLETTQQSLDSSM